MTAGKNRAVKYGIYCLELLVLLVLQNIPGLLPPVFGARPQLLLAAVLTIAILEPEIPAIFFGLGGGLLLDISFGGSIGLMAIIMAVLCCAASALIKKMHVTMLTAFGMGGLFLLIATVLDWLLRYMLAGYSAPLFILVDQFLPRYFYTLLAVPLAYLVNLGLYMGLRPLGETEE